jgi:hypothetical protein
MPQEWPKGACWQSHSGVAALVVEWSLAAQRVPFRFSGFPPGIRAKITSEFAFGARPIRIENWSLKICHWQLKTASNYQ